MIRRMDHHHGLAEESGDTAVVHSGRCAVRAMPRIHTAKHDAVRYFFRLKRSVLSD